jgi:uncharacterized protein YdhG (YjbR/CyaY superfamily)
MAKPSFASVDEYLAAQPVAVQPILKRVRGVIRKAVPDAEETISYQIPTYKRQGRAVIFFAGWKQHYSVYPASARVLEAFGKQLARYEVAKGTIKFPFSQPVPATLIAGVAKVLAKEAAEKARPAARPKKR